MQRSPTVVVIGAGIIGLAVADAIQRRRPGTPVVVLEKETRIAAHQTGHNSGVIHAGVYYEPGSLKARFCRAGLAATVAFCREHDVSFEQCGKLIVAVEPAELPRLQALAMRADAQGSPVAWMTQDELKEVEPAVAGIAALRVPDTGIVDYPGLCAALARRITARGGEIRLGCRVHGLRETPGEVAVETDQGELIGGQLIACGGLQADRLVRLAGHRPGFAIVPFRGDYFRLPPARNDLVRHLIYPVPDPALPFLGIHLTRHVDGSVSVGPSAMLALARERYSRLGFSPRDAWAAATYGGTWRLLARHARAGLREFHCALRKRRYLQEVQRYCPDIELADLTPMPPGIRAQAVTPDGRLLHDFLIEQTRRALHVCNAPSPAATAAFPIAEEIARRAGF